MRGHAVMGKQGVQDGLSTHPCGGQVLRMSKAEVFFPAFTTWEARQEVQDPVGQGRFRTRASSLVMSLEGTMVLNAELYSIHSIIT